MEFFDERTGEFLPDRETFFGRFSVDGALDIEQGIDAGHGLERDR